MLGRDLLVLEHGAKAAFPSVPGCRMEARLMAGTAEKMQIPNAMKAESQV